MAKPTDSKSPHRPISKASEGKKVTIPAVIVQAGHVSSLIRIGPVDVRIGNSALREATGQHDL